MPITANTFRILSCEAKFIDKTSLEYLEEQGFAKNDGFGIELNDEGRKLRRMIILGKGS